MGALLTLLLGLFTALAALAWLRRPRLGRFVITTDDERSFSFVTDTGRFRIELEKRELTLRGSSGTRSVPLDQLERFDFAHAAELPGLESSAGASPMHWLTLWLVLAGGERVQLFAIGELEPLDPRVRSLFAFETSLLARLGLHRDLEPTARKVLERIQAGFARSGRELGLD